MFPHLYFGIIKCMDPLLKLPSSLLLFRKHFGQPLMVINVPSCIPSLLFYDTNNTTGLRFLVGIEEEVSVIPPLVSNHNHHKFNLVVNNDIW